MLNFFAPSVIAALLISTSAHAAVSRVNKKTSIVPSSAAQIQQTKEALDLPSDNRLQALFAQGPQGYRNLTKIMFDREVPMELRWRAVSAAAHIGGVESKPELERALKSQDWYMRNAGLLSVANIDHKSGVKWARQLLSDPALVVRAAAVTTLADLKDQTSTALLWQKLNAPENFKNHESLFIRRRIVEALAALESPESESKFVALLADRDETIHPVAIHALERLTHQTLGRPTDSVASSREQWLQWWKSQSSAKL